MYKSYSMFGWKSATTFIWAFVAISCWFWTQATFSARAYNTADAAPALKMPDMTSTTVLAGLLGALPLSQTDPRPDLVSRFILFGVIASKVGQGAALISVDGKPAQPFAVGSKLAPGYMLVSVALREAMLAEDMNMPVSLTLKLPLQASAQSPTALQIAVSNVPSAAMFPISPVPGVASVLPLVNPGLSEETLPVPASADARRPPQSLLRREDQRAP